MLVRIKSKEYSILLPLLFEKKILPLNQVQDYPMFYFQISEIPRVTLRNLFHLFFPISSTISLIPIAIILPKKLATA